MNEVNVAAILSEIPTPPPGSAEVWGQRLDSGNLVVARSSSRLYLLGPSVAGIGRIQVQDCILDASIQFSWIEDGIARSETITSFSVTAGMTATSSAFAQAIQSIVGFLGTTPTGQELIDLLEAWLVVLSNRDMPTESDLVGLWGELFAIKSSQDPLSAIAMWQWRDAAPIDFSSGTYSVEVKTASSGRRVHTLSLGQVREGVGRRAFLLSIVTRWAPDGLPLLTLINQVTELVQDDSAAVRTVASAVARRIGLFLAPDECPLDEYQASSSARWIDFREVDALLSIPGLLEGRLTIDFDDPRIESTDFFDGVPFPP